MTEELQAVTRSTAVYIYCGHRTTEAPISYIHISRYSLDSPHISDVEQLLSAVQYGISCRVLCMLGGGGDKGGCVDVSADVTVKSKHPRSTLRAGAGMGAGAEPSCRRHGEALVLIFINVICFGD